MNDKTTPRSKEKIDTCIRYNDLGQCIEWVNVGNDIMPVFKEEAKKCSPKMWDKWKEITQKRRIIVKPEDD